MAKPTVASDGSIIMPAVDVKQPDVPKIEGSMIHASAKSIDETIATQSDAIKVLGGKVGGRRRYRLRLRGGAEVEVKNVPTLVSAGGTDPNAGFAELLRTTHKAEADAAYDNLGNQGAKTLDADKVTGGRRRRGKKTTKKTNGRTKRRSLRKHRSTRRGARRVRHTRR